MKQKLELNKKLRAASVFILPDTLHFWFYDICRGAYPWNSWMDWFCHESERAKSCALSLFRV